MQLRIFNWLKFYRSVTHISKQKLEVWWEKEKIIKAWDNPEAADRVEKQLMEDDFLAGFNFEHERSGNVQVLLYAKDMKMFREYRCATRK